VVVIGDEKGRVGVGTATAKEVVDAVQKAVSNCSLPATLKCNLFQYIILKVLLQPAVRQLASSK